MARVELRGHRDTHADEHTPVSIPPTPITNGEDFVMPKEIDKLQTTIENMASSSIGTASDDGTATPSTAMHTGQNNAIVHNPDTRGVAICIDKGRPHDGFKLRSVPHSANSIC